MLKKQQKNIIIAVTAVAIVAVVGLSVVLARTVSQRNELQSQKAQLESMLAQIQEELNITNEGLVLLQEQKSEVEDELRREKNKNEEFEEQIEEIAGTVGVLEKISKTDPELLQKYSKVYFLNEHYSPENLRSVPEEYTVNENRDYQVHSGVYPFLKDLLEEAEDDGLNLRVASAFRSFGEQSSIKSTYVQIYGAGTANQFSADQGYSEHQLGTTIDFATAQNPSLTIAFENTEEFEWLEDNAHKYGFTLSYPPNNSYYQYEPWHWRFVGRDLAKDLKKDGKFFYDLDQREIDGYIAEFFD